MRAVEGSSLDDGRRLSRKHLRYQTEDRAEIRETKCAVIAGLTTLCYEVYSNFVTAAAMAKILLCWDEESRTINVLPLKRRVYQSVSCLDW